MNINSAFPFSMNTTIDIRQSSFRLDVVQTVGDLFKCLPQPYRNTLRSKIQIMDQYS